MSNYLNNLAARSIGRAEEFRPRLPSLFEPASDRTGSSLISRYHLEDAADQELPSDAAAQDRPVQDAMAGRQGPHLEDEPDPLQQSRMRTSATSLENAEPGGEARLLKRQQPPAGEIETRAAVLRDSSASRLERHEEKPDSTSNARPENARTKDGASAPARHAPMLELSRKDLDAVNQGALAKARIDVAGQSLDQPRDQMLNHAPSRFSRGDSSTDFETSDNGPSENGRSENGPADTTYSEAAGLGERRAVTPASLRAQPASTIKVTIGRVEVRAIVNESQPRRPESIKAKPRMTLDEYLKQRNGGQR